MTIQFNIKNPEGLKQGELLIYNGKKFEAIKKEHLLEGVMKDFAVLKKEFEMLREQTRVLKEQINKRQKRFLGAFVKEVK
jgi:hypothetical protein